MISQKPYLIKAIHEWCIDNHFTPYIASVVDEKTKVPAQYVEDNQIIFDISKTSVRDLIIDTNWITFYAMFGGIEQHLSIPTGNIIAIFAKENGQGMQFNVDTSTAKKEPNNGLKLVK
jgi:stringent starvation protein B